VRAIDVFAQVVEPVKNMGRSTYRAILSGDRSPQTHIDLADATLPESLIARKFELDVKQLLAAPHIDAGLLARLHAQLSSWKDNHQAFIAASAASSTLRAAIPVSRELQLTAEAGLDALQALASLKPLSTAKMKRHREVIQRQASWAAASSTPERALTQPQPPADLLIAIVPAVRTLLDRAASSMALNATGSL
jgi:hypothetical protein